MDLLGAFVDQHFAAILVIAVILGVLTGGVFVVCASSATIATTLVNVSIGAALGGVLLGGACFGAMSLLGEGDPGSPPAPSRRWLVERVTGQPDRSMAFRVIGDGESRMLLGLDDLRHFLSSLDADVAIVQCSPETPPLLKERIGDLVSTYGIRFDDLGEEDARLE